MSIKGGRDVLSSVLANYTTRVEFDFRQKLYLVSTLSLSGVFQRGEL